MAKKTVATLQNKDGRSYTKVIKMFKSPKTGAYAFDEKMIPAELVKDYLKDWFCILNNSEKDTFGDTFRVFFDIKALNLSIFGEVFLLFHENILPLAPPKVLLFGKIQIYLVILLLIRTFVTFKEILVL